MSSRAALSRPSSPAAPAASSDVVRHDDTRLPGGLVNARSYGATGDGTTDDTSALQAALAATAPGGICYLPPGTYRTSAPLVVPPMVTLRGAHAVSLTYASGPAIPCSIKPLASFAGAAVLRCVDKTTGGYAADSVGQRIEHLTIDGSAGPANLSGVQLYGNVREVVHERVTVRSVTGDGFSTTGYGTYSGDARPPSSSKWLHCYADGVGNAGFVLSSTTDCTLADCNAQGCGYVGFYANAAPNTLMSTCRAEWAGQHGFMITGAWGSGTGCGGLQMTGCSTDRNTFHGVLVNATGTGQVNIVGLVCRRDGRNSGSGGGGWAGLAVASATMPVIVDGILCFPGVDDDGTGTASPQYGIVVTGTPAHVSIDSGYLHAITAAASLTQTSGYVSVSPTIGTATGTTASPTRVNPINWAPLDPNLRVPAANMPLVDHPVRSGTVSASLTSDASLLAASGGGNRIDLTLTGNATLGPPTNPANHQKLTYHLLASGAARTVTFGAGVLACAGWGLSYVIPQNAILRVELEYVGLLGTPAWVIVNVGIVGTPPMAEADYQQASATAQSILSAADIRVLFDQVNTSTADLTAATVTLASTPTSPGTVFTVQRAGLWTISASLAFAAAAAVANLGMAIADSGSTTTYPVTFANRFAAQSGNGPSSATAHSMRNVSITRRFAVGAVFSIMAYQDSGAALALRSSFNNIVRMNATWLRP